MPICTIHLLSLSVPLSTFLQTLSSTSLKPLTISRVIRWIILPSHLSTIPLLAQNIHWEILLILPSLSSPLPSSLQHEVTHHWSLEAGIPSRLLENYASKNARLLHPEKGDVKPLKGALDSLKERRKKEGQMPKSSQDLELSPELLSWIENFTSSGTREAEGAVSMLNLLAFEPGRKAEYLKYGAAFAASAGSSRGGNAKIVGSVIKSDTGGNQDEGEDVKGEGWDEIALAHYPSLWHFADMLASEEYQDVNKRYRVGSLRDTCILCTSEVGIEEMVGMGVTSAKL
ncbi:uncharacterized protein RAG0_06046 [Rhynchosporium agropyri]|uniref:Uncharacterized protein n=1 Tax=Rhynchosporium agropyri TaxID=914238 RepID=A0A1E1KFQ2_9HELO|nr:uncharacterized protein RAG0_06046 [Rhynchosporium agropyri]